MSLPSFSVEGKFTIVTGAGRGIGNTLARGFALAGAKVVLASRTASELEAGAGEIRAAGARLSWSLPTSRTARRSPTW